METRITEALGAVKGWRTLIVSAAIAIAGVLQTADWATIVGPAEVGPAMLITAAAVAVLRALTDTPIGGK